MTDEFSLIASRLKLAPEQVRVTAELLDSGNTIPFIARFRKDQTGGLDADQILAIRKILAGHRALEERKTFVLKSVESQEALTPPLEQAIRKATNSRDLEDLYLPFKTKKQSLALTARQQGLEPLALEIVEGKLSTEEVAERAANLVRIDKGLASVGDVMLGVGHLIAEQFANHPELRHDLRQIVWRTGKVVCRLVTSENPVDESLKLPSGSVAETTALPLSSETGEAAAGKEKDSVKIEVPAEPAEPKASTSGLNSSEPSTAPLTLQPVPKLAEDQTPGEPAVAQTELNSHDEPNEDQPKKESPAAPLTETDTASLALPTDSQVAAVAEKSDSMPYPNPAPTGDNAEPAKTTSDSLPVKKKKKRKKNKPPENPFSDFENFEHPLEKLPHHRVLAINRGEKAGMVKARVRADQAEIEKCSLAKLVAEGHPFREVLSDCVRDALNRYILPSLEREVRRELTEAAESHAVDVFVHNLRALLMQPPVRGKKILAIDPGYKSGCSIAVVDPQGRFLTADKVYIVGNQQRKDENRKKLSGLIRQHSIDVVAIGNGAACREVEQLVSDAIANDLTGLQVQYVVVNEAGASIYSTSEIGKEELPDSAPGIRGAISIARRLIDPLSELVKINPCHLGIGLYQHDIKARHLADSLDEIVQECVNSVGVDVNTASPSLLRYVSGLNQLTARRLYEFRRENPITNREMIRQVAGIGDATFVQAAGFLRVYGGDNPLDETCIHPESYSVATKVLEQLGKTPTEWISRQAQTTPRTAPASDPASNPEGVSDELTDSDTASDTATSASRVETGLPTDESTSIELVTETGQSSDDSKLANEPATTAAETPPEVSCAKDSLIAGLNPVELASGFGVGELMMRDILDNLSRPRRDPRSSSNAPVFRSRLIGFDDLKPEMKLQAQVVNVVDFGIFVDVGLGHTSLVHISELSRGYINDLHQQFAVGNVLTTWVQEVDPARRRVKLSALPPGTKRFEKRSRRSNRRNDDHRTDSNSEQRPDQRNPDQQRRADQRDGNRRFDSRRGDDKPSGERSQQGANRNDRSRGSDNRGNRNSRGNQSGGNRGRSFERRPSKPKFVKPIDQDMLTGDKPMRSFSDLAQFFTKKEPDEKKKKD